MMCEDKQNATSKQFSSKSLYAHGFDLKNIFQVLKKLLPRTHLGYISVRHESTT